MAVNYKQAAGAEKTLLSVKDLNVSYGAIHAVRGISLTSTRADRLVNKRRR